MKEVRIIGAGLSGLTAGIILARDGHKVIIYDRQKGIGGSPNIHPSVHTTPAQLKELIEYTGINFTGQFVKSDPYPVFYYGKSRLTMPPYVRLNTAYCIERGARPSSMDNFLFTEAKNAGVEFEFDRNTNFSTLPDGTIMATGLDTHAYEKLGIPFKKVHGSWSWRERQSGRATAAMYMGSFSKEYSYTAEVNGLDYGLLFSTHPVTAQDETAFKKVLTALGMGDYPEPWRHMSIAVPLSAQLTSGNCILAGTLSGMIEPFWGYGIVGAIISGRIAAKAVIDFREAERDFALFTRGFQRKLMKRERFSAQPPLLREVFIKTALMVVRLQCLWDKKLAGSPREPVKWFR